MTSQSPTPQHGSYELVDNVDYGSHQQALMWLAEHYTGPLNVATGYVGLEGLDGPGHDSGGTGAAHPPLAGCRTGGHGRPTRGDRRPTASKQSVSALLRERDFSAFPAGPASRFSSG